MNELIKHFLLRLFREDLEVYPVFKEMLKMGDNAHYITGNLDIYKEHCGDDLYCKKILLITKTYCYLTIYNCVTE